MSSIFQLLTFVQKHHIATLPGTDYDAVIFNYPDQLLVTTLEKMAQSPDFDESALHIHLTPHPLPHPDLDDHSGAIAICFPDHKQKLSGGVSLSFTYAEEFKQLLQQAQKEKLEKARGWYELLEETKLQRGIREAERDLEFPEWEYHVLREGEKVQVLCSLFGRVSVRVLGE